MTNTYYSRLDLDDINELWFRESKEALEAERLKQGRRILQRQKTISWKDKVEEMNVNDESNAADELDWSFTYSHRSYNCDSDDDSDVGMTYSQNQRKLKTLAAIAEIAYVLPSLN
jgi:Tfp pilus assembly protein PilV